MRAAALALVATTLLSACAALRADAQLSDLEDTGVTLAQNVGPMLVIVELNPAGVGANSVRVLFDESGKPVSGSARVTLRGALGESVSELRAGQRGMLRVGEAGRYELKVEPAGGGSLAFMLDLPTERVDPAVLSKLDQAMSALRTLREAQTLTSGTFMYAFRDEYAAPDRLRSTYLGPDGQQHETVVVGARRWDRDGDGPWSASDLGSPSQVLRFTYSAQPHRVRIVRRDEGRPVIALVETSGSLQLYYQLRIAPTMDRVESYTMMAAGHYMTGTYSDFDAPLNIHAPGD